MGIRCLSTHLVMQKVSIVYAFSSICSSASVYELVLMMIHRFGVDEDEWYFWTFGVENVSFLFI